MNISYRQLTTQETAVLVKDGGFEVVPKILPVEHVIANVDIGIQCLLDANSRCDQMRVIENFATGLSSEIQPIATRHDSAKDLSNHTNIIILPDRCYCDYEH